MWLLGFIQVLFLIAIWVIPIFFFTNAYLKMEEEEQRAFKNEVKDPAALFGVGLIVIGLLLFSSGTISTVKLLQHIGAILVFLSWFITSIMNWKKRKMGVIKSIALMLLGIVGIATYGYLI